MAQAGSGSSVSPHLGDIRSKIAERLAEPVFEQLNSNHRTEPRGLSVAIGFRTAACFGAVNCHWCFRPLVHVELKDIRSSIVANNIQVEFASDNLCAVDLCSQNLLAIHVGPRQKIAEWINDTTAASIYNAIRIVLECRVIIG